MEFIITGLAIKTVQLRLEPPITDPPIRGQHQKRTKPLAIDLLHLLTKCPLFGDSTVHTML